MNTTLTPQEFLDENKVTGRQAIPATTGEKRAHTWSAFQPQVILRWQATDEVNLYTDYSRGFRSGGFNQTGVAQASQAAGFDNVGDLFNAETADTFEAGFKSHWMDGRLLLNGSAYLTEDHNDYYFVFLASNSTQNLGNIKKVEFAGWDLDMNGRIDDNLSVNAGFGYTSSVVKQFPGPSSALVVGSRAPLVSDYTANIGVQYDRDLGDGFSFHSRLDYNRIGDTTFVIPVPAAGEPVPVARRPIDLVDLRAGLEKGGWMATFWSKNLFDKKYNTEYSTGGFLFKADGRQVGIDLTKRF